MQAQPEFGFKQLLTHVIGDMARALSERSGEDKQHQATRTQSAVHTIMGFRPRDAIEAMLAGHCVMFHELMTDSTRGTLRGEMDNVRRATRSNIVAMDRSFNASLDRLERCQNRVSDGDRDVTVTEPAQVRPEAVQKPVVAKRAETPRPAQTRPIQTPAAERSPAQDTPPRSPSIRMEAIEAIRTEVAASALGFAPEARASYCLASPIAAQAALLAGDVGRFTMSGGFARVAEVVPGSPVDGAGAADRNVP
jgi:hypothetical protein